MATGWVDVDAMLHSLSHKQWFEWIVYLERYGLPETNADGRVIDQLIVSANMQRAKGKRAAELTYFTGDKFAGEEVSPTDRMAQLRNQMVSLANK